MILSKWSTCTVHQKSLIQDVPTQYSCDKACSLWYISLSLSLSLSLRHKHPPKVHVWAGISLKGKTGICIFDGITKKELFINMLNSTLLPFIRETYPNRHKLMQDNDPKHTSCAAQRWMEDNGVTWWRTPAESPNLNPIQNLHIWHEFKEYIRHEVKPKTKSEFVNMVFVNSGTQLMCRSAPSTFTICVK